MSDRRSIHDGWTPQPQEQEQPGDPLSVPADPLSPLTELAALLHNFDPEWCRHEDGSAFGECDARAKALLFAGVTLASSPAPAGSICKCGLAKSYHGSGTSALKPLEEYEPRYPAPAGLDVERLGLSDEQTVILRGHLASRQQTVAEFFGDVLMEYGLGRATGKDYPPPAATRPAVDAEE